MSVDLFGRPALLFLPASRAGAILRAKSSLADIVVLDLEDAVREEDKGRARDAAVAAVAESWPMPVAIRVNGTGTRWHEADLEASKNAQCDLVVLPGAASGEEVREAADTCGKPVVAMVETAVGVLAAPAIAQAAAAIVVGTNDLAADLQLPADAGRESMSFALQQSVVAARAASIAIFDGVFNRLDDADGLLAEAREGRQLGFDGKSLIHPDQISPCHLAFAPSPEEIARAERLVAAATGGAERFEGQMIEAMHVATARRLLARR